jgi:hypothetical protein
MSALSEWWVRVASGLGVELWDIVRPSPRRRK